MTTIPHPDATLLSIVERDLWHLDHELVAGFERRMVADVARWFPAPFAAQYGLELDLPRPASGMRATVDLSVGLDRRSPAAAILAGRADAPLHDALFRDATWRGLRDFGARWTARTDHASATIPRIWLAFPQPDRPGRIPIPAITFGLEREATTADAMAVLEVIGGIAPAVASQQREPFARVLDAIGRAPAYLAVFPTRSATALRIELEVQRSEIAGLLATIGWPGDRQRLALLSAWAARGDIIRLSIDLDRAIAPRIGLALGSTGHWATRIGQQLAMLYELADLGAISRITAERVASGLRRDVERDDDGGRALVQHGLSHVKATLEADGSVRAKAYTGAARQPLPLPLAADRAAGSPTEAVTNARRRAVTYLLGAQAESGGWPALVDVGGFATTWVTAHTAHALAIEGSPRALAAARRGWQYLVTQRQPAGWRYTETFEPDADTTTWTLRLADALGLLQNPDHAVLIDLLAPFITADGAGLRPFVDFLEEPVAGNQRLAGYDQLHCCITAAAAGLPGAPARFIDTLRRAQLADGSWFPHWWAESEYATAFAVEALLRAGDHEEDADRLGWAAAWVRGRIGDDGSANSRVTGEPSPFATALAANALAQLGDPAAARPLAWLAAAQLPDGSWVSADWMLRPLLSEPFPGRLPDDRLRPSLAVGLAVVADGTGIFTTATVLRALAAPG